MSGNSNEARLEDILAACTAQLFVEQNVRADRISGDYRPPSLRESLAASCGFGGTDVRGALTILGSAPLFSRIHPLPMTASPRDLVDWARELVNQTVGRFRNRLLAYQVRLAPGVPESAPAAKLRPPSRAHQRRKPICFCIEGEVLEMWLELAVRPDFRLPDSATNQGAVALPEGSVLFFQCT